MNMYHQPLHVVGLGGTLHDNSTSLIALERALKAAQQAGATVELLDLNLLDLPMYRPGRKLEDFGHAVHKMIAATRRADAMLWSTAAYHGTLAGVTKNALDYMEFLAGGENAYLQNKVVGLIATAGGDQAGVNTVNAMVNIVHSLRGTAAPLSVPIASAWKVFDDEGVITDKKTVQRLDKLGGLVVEMARYFQTRHLPQSINAN